MPKIIAFSMLFTNEDKFKLENPHTTIVMMCHPTKIYGPKVLLLTKIKP